MGIFDWLLRRKTFSTEHENQKQPIKNKEKKEPLSLKELLYASYHLKGWEIEDITVEYTAPALENLLQNDYQKKLFDNNPEEYENKYFYVFAIAHLVYHNPEHSIIEALVQKLFSSTENNYSIKEAVRNKGRDGLSNHPEKHAVISTGLALLKTYHALFMRKDANFSYPQQVPAYFKETILLNHEQAFQKFIRVLQHQLTFETPYILIHGIKISNYNRHDKSYSSISPRKKEILEILSVVIPQFNQKYGFILNIESVELLSEHILQVELSESFRNAAYKDHKSMGLKKVPELNLFMQEAKALMPYFLDAWCYYNSFYYGSNLTKLFKEISTELLKGHWEHSDLIRCMNHQPKIDKESMRTLIMPTFEAYSRSENYSKKLTSRFEKYLFHYYGHVDAKGLPKKVLAALENMIPHELNDLEISFKKLIYNSPLQSGSMQSTSFGLFNNSVKTLEQNIIILHKQLSFYLPSSIKSINKGGYYSVDNHVFVLNVEGEDHYLGHDMNQAFNKLLAERKAGVRVVPIPLVETVNYRKEPFFITCLSVVNYAQFKHLLNQYLPLHFPKLSQHKIYQIIDFENTKAESVEEKKEAGTIGEGEGLFTKGFAHDVKWAWFKETYTDKLKSKHLWYKAMDVLIAFSGTKKPAKHWEEQMNKVIDEFGETQYFDEMNSLIHESKEEKSWFFDDYNKALKGMLWSCLMRSSESSLLIIKTVCEMSYTKITGYGPRSTKTGNFCLELLEKSESPKAYGIMQLMQLKSRYNRFIRAIDKYIDKYKQTHKGQIESLEEQALPDFGFQKGSKRYHFIDAELEVVFTAGKMTKTYIVNGKRQKKIPDVINQKHAARLKEVNAELKQINEVFKSLKERVRTYWLYDRNWNFGDWNKYLLAHPLMGSVLQHSIWIALDSEEVFIVEGDQLLQASGAVLSLDKQEKVKLWHPVESNPHEREELQNFSKKKKIRPIEKQIDREYFEMSKEESKSNYSLRFSDHSLFTNKLMAIANASGWTFTYVHEDVSWPRIYLHTLDLSAHLYCDYNRTSKMVPIGKLFFTKGDCKHISMKTMEEAIPLKEIPTTCFSEICRDISLFISKAK